MEPIDESVSSPSPNNIKRQPIMTNVIYKNKNLYYLNKSNQKSRELVIANQNLAKPTFHSTTTNNHKNRTIAEEDLYKNTGVLSGKINTNSNQMYASENGPDSSRLENLNYIDRVVQPGATFKMQSMVNAMF